MIEIFSNAYCVLCKTGSENVIARRINDLDKNITAISPVRVLQEKYKQQWITRERLLIPGYIFIYVNKIISFDKIIKSTGAYKFLEYQTGDRELIGSDFEYAAWIYSHDGKITPSRALIEGDEVNVVDGPLKDGIGTILKLDRHKRRAWVEFNFYGKAHRVSLSVIDIEPV